MIDERRVSLDTCAQQELIELARSAGSDSQRALELLFQQHQGLMRRLLRAVGVSPQRLEDALQGARFGFWVALQRYDPGKGASLATYARLFIVEHARLELHRSVDRFTRSAWAARRANPEVPPVLQFDALAEESHPPVEPDDVVTRLVVRDFVISLRPADQQLVILVYWRGFTPAEVARFMRVSRSAVSQRLARIHRLGQVYLADFAPRQ